MCEALEMALLQHPASQLRHSNHEVQSVCGEDVARLQSLGVQGGLSTIGRPTENGSCERLTRTLQVELGVEVFASRDQARASVFEYLEVFYNRVRRHSALGYLNPAEYERTHNQTHR